MANMEVASMQQATLVVGVIAMATDNEDGISDDSQVYKTQHGCLKRNLNR